MAVGKFLFVLRQLLQAQRCLSSFVKSFLKALCFLLISRKTVKISWIVLLHVSCHKYLPLKFFENEKAKFVNLSIFHKIHQYLVKLSKTFIKFRQTNCRQVQVHKLTCHKQPEKNVFLKVVYCMFNSCFVYVRQLIKRLSSPSSIKYALISHFANSIFIIRRFKNRDRENLKSGEHFLKCLAWRNKFDKWDRQQISPTTL